MRFGPVLSQFADRTLTAAEAMAACGPAAALAFARVNGRNPTLREAVDLAKHVGWTPEGGMNGFQNQVRLLGVMKEKGLVGDFEAAAQPDWQRVTQEAQAGRPVTISTPRHYFTVSGFDPARGFYVGASGTDLEGGEEWMTAEEIAQHGRGVNGALYLTPASRERQQFLEANTQLGQADPSVKTQVTPPDQPRDPSLPDPLAEWLKGQQALDAFSRRLATQVPEPLALPGLPKVDLGWGPRFRLPV